MSALRQASVRWAQSAADAEADLPAGITVTPVDIESGRAISRKSGLIHIVADAAIISDGEDERLAASWLCGSASADAAEVPDDREPVCANCQLAARLPRQPCVYRAYDAAGCLLYIGSTINAAQRVRAHTKSTPWWPEVARLSFEECASEHDARRVEAEAIWNEPSKYNRSGTPGRGTQLVDLLDGIVIEGDAS